MTTDTRRIRGRLAAALLSSLLSGCTCAPDPTGSDAGAPITPIDDDAGVVADAGGLDGGVDAGEDAGTGPVDAGADGGVSGPCGDDACTWTVLVYMAADNNLEEFAMRDLSEMLDADLGPGVRVLVQVDRASGFYPLGVDGLADWETMRRFEVTSGGLVEVADLGEQNTGDPQILEDFIAWGFTSYPADRYALVMWNHGNSWQGYGGDDASGHDRLTHSEIGDAIADGIAAAGLSNVDLLGFDACLMSSLDTARLVRPFTRNFIASEEVEPAHGWSYTAWLSFLSANPDADVADIAGEAVESFWQQARDERKHRYVTLNVLDLDAMDALDTALGAFVADVALHIDVVDDSLAAARASAVSFGRHSDPAHAYHMVDLGDLVTRLAALEPSFAAHRDAILAALDEMNLASRYGETVDHATGLTVYFPPHELYYLSEYAALGEAADWRELLAAFYARPAGLSPSLDDLGASASCDADRGPVASAPVEGALDAIAGAYVLGGLYRADGSAHVLSRAPALVDSSGVSGAWSRRVLVASQGDVQRLLFAEVEPSDDPRLEILRVPLTRTAPLECPCLSPGQPGYSDADGDDLPDCADTDVDADGVPDKGDNAGDNCPWLPNASQLDDDDDGVGNACEAASGAPPLACTPPPGGVFAARDAAFWLVVVDRLHGRADSTSLFVAGGAGVAEYQPEPGAVLWTHELVPSDDGRLSWQVGSPLPFNLRQPIHLRVADVDEVWALGPDGAPLTGGDGQPVSALPSLGYAATGDAFLALEIEDHAGNRDSVVVVPDDACVAPPLVLCPPGETPDCDGACYPDARFAPDQVCDDGSGAGPNLACALHDLDFGDCLLDCGQGCLCGDGVCSPGEDCVGCEADCGACPLCGDLVCEAWSTSAPYPVERAESCATCSLDCGWCAGDCCVATAGFTGGGCADQDVAACVCALDPSCCTSGWRQECVDLAQQSCSLTCDACPSGRGFDLDGDLVCGDVDNCPLMPNGSQEDADADGVGDACDFCPGVVASPWADTDEDGIGDGCDVCPTLHEMELVDVGQGGPVPLDLVELVSPNDCSAVSGFGARVVVAFQGATGVRLSRDSDTPPLYVALEPPFGEVGVCEGGAAARCEAFALDTTVEIPAEGLTRLLIVAPGSAPLPTTTITFTPVFP